MVHMGPQGRGVERVERVQVEEGNPESRSQNSEGKIFRQFPFLIVIVVVVVIVVDFSTFPTFTATITIATTTTIG